MDGLYPNLQERFKSEGLCQICLMEMELTPRYSCENEHTMCHRCKPYYYACPTCRSPMDIQIPPQYTAPYPPPSTHFVPHPMPPQFHSQHPSAPLMDDFIAHERHAWSTPPPTEDQDLRPCSYSHLGCWVKVPIYLQELHESRCQFRPNLEEEHLPTDLNRSEDELVECAYTVAGCRVRTSPWRLSIHQNYCIYKDKYDEMTHISTGLETVTITSHDPDEDGDPEELVECRYRRYGCKVNMPRRRKYIHEQKCNYNKYYEECDELDQHDEPETHSSDDNYGDPDEQLPCRWSEYGCRVKPKRSRKEMHEEKCNYRMEECAYRDYGCYAMFPPARKYAHERSCEYAN